MSRMFPFITETWNPLGGRCPHRCIYCWSRRLEKRYGIKKYQGSFRLIEKELNRKFKPGAFVFVQDMSDLFAVEVPSELIRVILRKIGEFPKTNFLLQTKNPSCYIPFLFSFEIPENAVLGTTIETDSCHFYTPSPFKCYWQISDAEDPELRLIAMQRIAEKHTGHRIFISIEPILDFTKDFAEQIRMIKPWAVAVGYDNYGNRLPEPSLKKTLHLIQELEKFTIVYRKTLRKAWWEK